VNEHSLNEVKSGIFVEKLKREKKYDMPIQHYHDAYEIYYLVSGERKYFIKDSIYKITPGMLVIIEDNVIHKTMNCDEVSHERILINFDKDYLKDVIPSIGEINLLACFASDIKVVRPSFHQKEQIESLLYQLIDAKNCNSKYSKIQCKLLLCQILVSLNEYIDDISNKDEDYIYQINPKITEIIKYINTHYFENITLHSLSDKFYISPFYLSKLFKQTTNVTIIQYLNTIRIKNSKFLLAHTNDKIIEIAYKVGYNNNTHFTRVFKQLSKESPTQYRKRICSNTQ